MLAMLQPHVAYSGADDSMFKGWDIRQPDSPTFVNRREHGAGVCCIQSHPTRPHCCATGSYDEHVRLWDMRNTCAPISTSKVCSLHPLPPFGRHCLTLHQACSSVATKLS